MADRDYITNPYTNRLVSVHKQTGQYIIKQYYAKQIKLSKKDAQKIRKLKGGSGDEASLDRINEKIESYNILNGILNLPEEMKGEIWNKFCIQTDLSTNATLSRVAKNYKDALNNAIITIDTIINDLCDITDSIINEEIKSTTLTERVSSFMAKLNYICVI